MILKESDDFLKVKETFSLDDKVVNVSIPSVVPKLKSEIIEYLYSNYSSNEIYHKIQDYEQKDHYEKKVNTIGIWMSGGADSSLLAYVLAKKIKDEKLRIKLQPLSVRRGRPNNPIYAGNVIDFIEEDLNFKMNDHIIYYPPMDDEHYREIEVFKEKDDINFKDDLFQVLYSGITCNPPSDDKSISKNKERSRDEDTKRPLKTFNGIRYYMNPFFCINKRELRMIYDQLKLTDKLFPLTYSCEGTAEDTKTHTQHCEKCWWCQERFWAFGKYI
jgi:hypothetical protein|tara:strand:+ start:206 stop:1024 length:819 start_codon:yes stop_codon:yes gene_type:complete